MECPLQVGGLAGPTSFLTVMQTAYGTSTIASHPGVRTETQKELGHWDVDGVLRSLKGAADMPS